jgi:3'(2'), 5'-bisphosphate nucleotidase
MERLWSDLHRVLVPMYVEFRKRLTTLAIAEKDDRTLLTEADIAVEQAIVSLIREYDGSASIVAEESGTNVSGPKRSGVDRRVWVIDPIDGTSEFVRSDRTEFCSVVCLLEDMRPTATFILAPELGLGRTPITVTASTRDGTIHVNGDEVEFPPVRPLGRTASVTRSKSEPPRSFESAMLTAGYQMKVRTTSQTLDMVRTALDMSELVGPEFRSFDLFYRRKQKVWDGLAGMCLGETLGLPIRNREGAAVLPLATATLTQREPTFDSTIMGIPEAVEWFLSLDPS